ncbi:nuclear transport factor 2 family protein [Williamsia sp. 1138]|uniref:nuclear transport factor 2 family protein n=1 Tax=Williamsia sp. 1138 TaxID=1903117 RepID=UPI000B9AF45F|nr:nuclear transport factor 2 family protein [Williamsia sp. 1138]
MDVDEVCSRHEILDLISEYTLSNDRAEWERMDRIWADDAVMLVPGVGVGRYDGRETIMSRYRSLAARAKQAESARDEGKTAMTFSRHHLTSTRLSFLDSSHAVGVSYYFVITDVGYDHSGCYEDRFTRTAGRWLISERKTLVEHVASESFYGFLRAAAAQNNKQ